MDERYVYETEYWRIVLAADQTHLGRCLIILKNHREALADLEKEEIEDFFFIIKDLERNLKDNFSATMFNWTCLMNNAYKSSPQNPHVHWHLRPRYNKKIKFSGVVFEDVDFGHHYNSKSNKEVAKKIEKKIIQTMREGSKYRK